MNVVIFGATGMVGSGVLRECLHDPRVNAVVALGRSETGLTHPKLRELVHADFFDYSAIRGDLGGFDACFFCLGVSAMGMSEERYHRLTYDLTVAAAEALTELNPGLVFCYVSGVGADSSERGRFMWARVKGKTENRLLGMPFEAAHMFRPGYIQPVKGVRSKTALYRAIYAVAAPAYPLLRRLLPNRVTTTADVGRAMIAVAADSHPKPIIDVRDINRLAAR